MTPMITPKFTFVVLFFGFTLGTVSLRSKAMGELGCPAWTEHA
jgi:hypothetical protein